MDLRRILDIITENSGSVNQDDNPFSDNLKVMSLAQFVGKEAPESEEEVEEAKLTGVTARKFDEPELTSYLDRILAKDKDKLDKYKRPYIHSGNIIPIVKS